MSVDNHTPLSTGAAAQAATFNSVFSQLDASIKKNNYAATGAPAVGDDTADGYTVGSRWIDTTNDRAYVAVDVTLGAAVWKEMSFPASVTQNFGITGTLTVTGAEVIDQLTADTAIEEWQSTGDVAHGMTSLDNTATFGKWLKNHATEGGVRIIPYTSNIEAFKILARATNEDATRSTAARGYINYDSQRKSGTSVTGPSADKNLFTGATNGATRFIFDTDGDLHLDASSNNTVWDAHDDLALIETYRVLTANPNFKRQFATQLEQHARVLADTGVITLNDDGHHFVSLKGLLGLLMDALRQMGQRLEQIEDAKRTRKTNRKPAKRKIGNAKNRRIARGVV